MKRKSQIWDQVEYFGQDYNNFQMYAFLDVDGRLDEAILQKAARLSFDIFPILRSRYVESGVRAYWQELDDDSIPEFFYFAEDASEPETLTLPVEISTDAFAGPQVLIRHTRFKAHDRVCIVMNHMICDAAGFKRFLYELSELYSRLLDDPGYRPGFRLDGNRSGVEVYRGFIRNAKGVKAKILALFQFQQYRNFRNELSLPGGGMEKPFISSFTLSAERFDSLKAYSKENNVTINDIFLAAFYRAVARQFPDGAEQLTIPFMIDLRRLLPERDPSALSNLTSTIRLSLENNPDESADETVQRVSRKVRAQLKHMDVMNGYLFLLIFFRLMPYPLFRRLIDRLFHSFPIAFSNLGILDEGRLRFGDMGLKDCFMTGSIKNKPCFWMAMSSFSGRITMTVNLVGADADRLYTERFLKNVEQQLPV